MACVHSCIVLLAVAVAVALSLDIASAKPAGPERALSVRASAVRGAYPLRRRFTARGCSSFGHSCFGGHGKRSDDEFPPAEFPPVEPESENRVQLDNYKQGDIVPLLRQWLQLQSYRRMAESNPN